MPSVKQRRVAKKIVENATLDHPLTSGEIVESSGYGVSMKKNPQVVVNSAGVVEALHEYGFTEDGAKGVVQEIMYNDKVDASARLKATDQVFKVHGSYAPEKSVNLHIEQQMMGDEEVKKLAAALEEQMKNGDG